MQMKCARSLFAGLTLASLVSHAGESALPDDLKTGLSMWFDANSNVWTDETAGGVTYWLDVRENPLQDAADLAARLSANNWAYVRAMAYLPDPANDYTATPPTLTTDDRHPGLSFVDFGDYASGRWLYFANRKGEKIRKNVGSFFVVIGFRTKNNFGHLFGDVGALNTYSANAGQMFFHKQYGSQAGGCISSSDYTASVMGDGETRINGRLVNPLAETYSFDDFQVLSQNGPELAYRNSCYQMPFVSTLFNQINCPGRQGGGIVGEILVYDRVLPEGERARVEAYLADKWLGLSLEAEAVSRKNAIVAEPVAGKKLVTDGWTASVVDGTHSDRFEIEGTGDNVSVGIPAEGLGNVKIGVQGAGLRLAAEAEEVQLPSGAPSVGSSEAPNLLTNASFEDPVSTDFLDRSPAGWSLVDYNRYLSIKGSAMWTGNGDVPDGKQFLTLSVAGNKIDGGAVSYRFNAPSDGRYKFSYWMTRRTNRSEGGSQNFGGGNTRLKVLIDDAVVHRNAVYQDHRGDENLFKHYETELPPLAAGWHTIQLRLDDNNNADRAVNIDDVRLWLVEAGEFVPVPDPGFDSSAEPVPRQNSGGTFVGYYLPSPTLAEWTFGSDASGEAGITQHSWYWELPDTSATAASPDYRKAYLRNDAFVKTSVTVPRAGRIRFSMRYASCLDCGFGSRAGQASFAGGSCCTVTLGETELAKVRPVSPTSSTFETTVDVAAGTYELKIHSTPPATSGQYVAVVDDLKMKYVDDEPVPTVLATGESFTTNFTVAADGFYAAVIGCAGPELQPTITNGVRNSAFYYPADARLTVDGAFAGEVRANASAISSAAVRLPYLTAGAHELAVTAIWSTTRLGGVSIVPLTVGDVGGDAYSDATFLLSSDASLDLQFLGSRELHKLRYGGHSVGGDVSAGLYPAWVSGPGMLHADLSGLSVILR